MSTVYLFLFLALLGLIFLSIPIVYDIASATFRKSLETRAGIIGESALGFDPAFLDQIKNWEHPDIVATGFAIEWSGDPKSLGPIPYDDLVERAISDAQSENASTTRKLELIRSAFVFLESSRVSVDEAPTELDSLIGPEKSNDLRNYIDAFFAELNTDSSCTLIDVDLASNIAHRLQISITRYKDNVRSYCLACYRGGRTPSFVLYPDSQVKCQTANNRVGRLSGRMDLGEAIEELISSLNGFVSSCWVAENGAGGWGTHSNVPPNLMHTYFVAKLVSEGKVEWSMPENWKHQVRGFITRCRVGNAFSFSPGLEPNVLASRVAEELIEIVDETPADLDRQSIASSIRASFNDQWLTSGRITAI